MTTATANATAFYPAPDIDAAIARALAAVRDRPQPRLDGDRTAQKYAGMAQDFRVKAWEHLEQGDLAQASNKAWVGISKSRNCWNCRDGFRNLAFAVLRRWAGTSR